jgi:hypothetical protein
MFRKNPCKPYNFELGYLQVKNLQFFNQLGITKLSIGYGGSKG